MSKEVNMTTREILLMYYEEWSNCKTDEDFTEVETFYGKLFEDGFRVLPSKTKVIWKKK